MIISVFIALIVIVKISSVSSKKFGFLIKDEDDIFAEKFVAFGVLPDEITEAEMAHISDRMNKFYRADRQDRQQKFGTEGCKYSVTLSEQGRLSNVNYQVALKGELSNFLAYFRLTTINVADPLEIWTRVKFYSDPIASVHVGTFRTMRSMDSMNFRVLLLKAAFDNFDVQPNRNLKELYHPKKMSLAAIAEDENESNEEEKDAYNSRYTTLQFLSSTGSLRNPLVDSPPKSSSLRSKLINRGKSKCGSCINQCSIC